MIEKCELRPAAGRGERWNDRKVRAEAGRRPRRAV